MKLLTRLIIWCFNFLDHTPIRKETENETVTERGYWNRPASFWMTVWRRTWGPALSTDIGTRTSTLNWTTNLKLWSILITRTYVITICPRVYPIGGDTQLAHFWARKGSEVPTQFYEATLKKFLATYHQSLLNNGNTIEVNFQKTKTILN